MNLKLSVAALSLVLAIPASTVAQTPAASTPITSQTPATPNGTNTASPVAATPSTPMTKDELKAQRKQQKSREKAAKDSAKAAKAKDKALKGTRQSDNCLGTGAAPLIWRHSRVSLASRTRQPLALRLSPLHLPFNSVATGWGRQRRRGRLLCSPHSCGHRRESVPDRHHAAYAAPAQGPQPPAIPVESAHPR